MADFQLIDTPTLSRSSIDRAAELRADPDALAAGWATAMLLRVDPRGQVQVVDGGLGFFDAISHSPELDPNAVFLGVVDGRHVWAVRVEELDGKLRDLRSLGHLLDDASAGMFTTAVALLNWHQSALHSAVDGSRTRSANGGWSRISEAMGHEEFPRIDPAIICLVHDGHDRAVLARQTVWPERLFSLLAGFVEAGESFEHCVVREIREEVGLDVYDVRYLGSQPWPFPRSLMVGFSAVGDPDQPLLFADGEIAEAHWFTRDDIRGALAHGDWTSKSGHSLLLPGSISIARTIVTSWAHAS